MISEVQDNKVTCAACALPKLLYGGIGFHEEFTQEEI
jgi:hypothetical protein